MECDTFSLVGHLYVMYFRLVTVLLLVFINS